MVSLADMDVRVGGQYHIRFGVRGEAHYVTGIYREVTLHRKLVFSWVLKSMSEHESLITLTLRPSGAGTELSFVHEKFHDQTSRDGHNEGWAVIFEKLDRFLA